MKLIIQIPCYNEAGQIAATLAALPRQVAGFNAVEWLVIDDGSTDGTAEIARAAGADHVVRLRPNQGLARAFMAGIEASLSAGADVIVNTDADNQYDAGAIPALVAPVRAGEAQMAVGARPIGEIAHFSATKRALQRIGSWVVRQVSGVDVADAPSGFRAFSREAAVQLQVFNSHTYTLETLVQAGYLNLAVVSVPVAVNPPTRPSRLIRSVAGYVLRSGLTLVRIFVLYRPFRFFSAVSLVLALPGMLAIGRFLALWAAGDGGGRVQSLVLGGTLVVLAGVVFSAGLLADLVAANRRLLTEIRARQLMAESRAQETAQQRNSKLGSPT